MLGRRPLASLVLAALVGASLVAFTRPAPQAMAWQYRLALGSGIDISANAEAREAQRRDIEATINKIAGEGWELVQIVPGGAVFRRPR